ncbi:MAG: undecaprenyl-diphosphate phosphatase [Desulfovibrio sp.]|nr:undecaprenyl-diphosphate phosphatase [Desulfovibrio sp.]
MSDLLTAVILSVIEGVTEFLPVSSSGHLIVAGDLLNFTGARAETFEIVIQLGAILAVVVVYWQRFLGLLKPVPGENFSGSKGVWLLILTSFPACVAGLLFHSWIKEFLFRPITVAIGLAAGAVFMLLAEKYKPEARRETIDAITPKIALFVGICQCVALWPGFSRSASTIMGGMLMGVRRRAAVEYSFIAAVPIMFAASGYALLKSWRVLTVADLPFFAVGVAGAFISALFAVRFFVALIGRISLAPFAIYRLLIAPLVYYFMAY